MLTRCCCSGELEAALKAAQEEVRRKEEELRQAKTCADELVTRVRGELRQVEIQRDQALRDRDTLVTEVRCKIRTNFCVNIAMEFINYWRLNTYACG